MKHKISFCHELKNPIKECYTCDDYILNKPNQIIKCSKCKDNPGLWYFDGSSKIWVPDCKCYNLMDKLSIPTKDLCNNVEIEVKKQKTYGQDIDPNTGHLCFLSNYLKDKDVKCYYNLNGIIPNFKENDIGCNLPNKEILRIPSEYTHGKCLSTNIDIFEELGNNDKLENCKLDNYSCSKFFNNTKLPKNHSYVKDIPPACFYKIPIKHGTSVEETRNIETNLGMVNIHGYQCFPCNLIDHLVQINELIYLFHKNEVYLYYKDNNGNIKIKNNNPQKINEIFPNIPINVDTMFYWENYRSLFIFRGDTFYKYNLDKKKILVTAKISSVWKGVPNNLDNVFLLRDKLVFIKQGYYYLVELYKNVKVYKNVYLIYLNKFKSVKTYLEATDIVNSTNGKMLNRSVILLLRKKINIYHLKGWCKDDNNYLYSISSNLDKSNKLIKSSISEKDKIGIWTILKKDSYIPAGTVTSCKSTGKLIKKHANDKGIRFEKIFNMGNGEFWCLNKNNLYFYSKNWRYIGKKIIDELFKNLVSIERDTTDLCILEKDIKNNFNFINTIKDNKKKTRNSLKTQLSKVENDLSLKRKIIDTKNQVVKILDNKLNTQNRLISQQNYSHSKTNFKIYIYYFLIGIIISIILYMIIKYLISNV